MFSSERVVGLKKWMNHRPRIGNQHIFLSSTGYVRTNQWGYLLGIYSIYIYIYICVYIYICINVYIYIYMYL